MDGIQPATLSAMAYLRASGPVYDSRCPSAYADDPVLDNWAYQANVRDYIYRLQQKVEANTEQKYYPTVMSEMQSRTKEQLQRYAQTYLGIDPRTVNVTFPWNRLFEVYVDVHAQPDVSLESDVRQGLRQKELDRLAAQQEAARKALEAEKQKTVKDKNAKIDPKVKEELEQAEQAAREQYEAELQSQQLAREEEQAQNNRTWVPKD